MMKPLQITDMFCGAKEYKRDGHEIVLKLTLRESDYLSELLSQSNYGYGSDVRDSVTGKLESERLGIIEIITGANDD
jgi:hypothetical protein